MIEDKKGFVLTGIALLLAIPAVVLMASFINMLHYGDMGVQIAVSGDNVFYTCDNLLGFLDDGARAGDRSTVLSQAAAYAQARGINFTATPLTAPYYQITVEVDGRMKCDRTIDLRNGTLNVDLTLSNYNTTYQGTPVYLRTGNNSIINTSTRVTFPSGSPATGANVTVVTLGNSTSSPPLADANGYYNVSFNISDYYDPSDDCSTKSVIGQQTATATATYTDFYDGVDTEDYLVLGNISNGNVEGYKPSKTTLGLKITLLDDFGYPVSQYPSGDSEKHPTLNCSGYTAPFPTITATMISYDDSKCGSDICQTWTAPTNITEDEPQGASSWDGIFWTNDSGYSYAVDKTYYANVSVSQPGYLPLTMSKEVSFTDLEATNVYNSSDNKISAVQGIGIGGGSGGKCEGGSHSGLVLNITNVGTTYPTTGKERDNAYTVDYKYCDGIGCNVSDPTTYKIYYFNATYDYPSGPTGRGGNWIVCAKNSSVVLGSGDMIFANITWYKFLEVDMTNNYINGTVP